MSVFTLGSPAMGLWPDTQNRGLRMRRECWERFPHHRLRRELPVSDTGMYNGTCVTHVSWCMLGSLNRGGGKKRSRHSWRMRILQFYVSGKSSILQSLYFIVAGLTTKLRATISKTTHRYRSGIHTNIDIVESLLIPEGYVHIHNISSAVEYHPGVSCNRAITSGYHSWDLLQYSLPIAAT